MSAFRLSRAGVASLVLVSALGCRPSTELREGVAGSIHPNHFAEPLSASIELTDLLGAVVVLRERSRFDLAETSTRDSVRGLGPTETWGSRKFAWAIAETPSVSFYVSRPRDLYLQLQIWRLENVEVADPSIEVEVNGQPVGHGVVPASRRRSLGFAIPASLLQVGRNTLAVRHRFGFQPATEFPEKRDQRTLRAAWGAVELIGLEQATAPRILGQGRETSLMIPVGCELRFAFRGSGAVHLRAETLRPSGFLAFGPPRLEVEVTSNGRQILETVVAEEGPLDLRFVAERGASVALVLRVPAEAGASAVEVGRPRLEPESAPTVTVVEDSPSTLPGTAKAANVVIFVVDTLRRDHLGVYGYSRPTSPNVDAFSRESVVFDQARAHSSWTRPSMTSLFTGLWPSSHGVEGDLDRMPNEALTLAERFQRGGYATAAVITNGAVSESFGFDQGFESFEYLPEDDGAPDFHQSSEAAVARAVDWLERRDRGRPYLLWVHTIDPHAPYRPPAELVEALGVKVEKPARGGLAHVEAITAGAIPLNRATIRDLTSLYDAEVLRSDRSFGTLLEALRRDGSYDDTMIVFVSDHGEELGDHGGLQHGLTLYQEQLAVPLVVKLPDGRAGGTRVLGVVQLVDLVPTLAELAGLAPAKDLDGRSLVQSIERGDAGSDRPVPSRLARIPDGARTEALEASHRKWIRYWLDERGGPLEELFDLELDPGEQTNIVRKARAWATLLSCWSRALAAPGTQWAPARAEIDDETRQNLEALGYLR
jgi:arylsulfatase A-like enzyme